MSEKLLPDAAVKAIQDSIKTSAIKVGSDDFLTREVFLPPAEPTAETIELKTLTGLLEYAATDFDGALGNGALIHVAAHDSVEVVGSINGRHSNRDVYAEAKAEPITFPFGNFRDCESFIIALQSQFVPSEELSAVLKVVGNIKEENVRQVGDDGVTQTVTGKSGISRAEELTVPNPVNLRPYRTFREIEQPASVFVLRMKQGRDGEMPTCALFEADGGKWKLDAIQAIKEYLTKKNKDVTVIA